eukprot:3789362-Pleurochrysis_carterae.AAC.1
MNAAWRASPSIAQSVLLSLPLLARPTPCPSGRPAGRCARRLSSQSCDAHPVGERAAAVALLLHHNCKVQLAAPLHPLDMRGTRQPAPCTAVALAPTLRQHPAVIASRAYLCALCAQALRVPGRLLGLPRVAHTAAAPAVERAIHRPRPVRPLAGALASVGALTDCTGGSARHSARALLRLVSAHSAHLVSVARPRPPAPTPPRRSCARVARSSSASRWARSWACRCATPRCSSARCASCSRSGRASSPSTSRRLAPSSSSTSPTTRTGGTATST